MSTRISSGDLVVPLSTIVDHLQDRLSNAEIEQLLFGIISQRTSEVRPGDLITADLMNQILGDIEALNVRVASLQGRGTLPGNAAAIATFHDAWRAYSTLAKNGEFLPATTTTAAALKSTVAITTHLQDIMYAALQGGALAYMGGTTALLDSFERLYQRQHELVILFTAPIGGISDTGAHKQFAALLNSALELDSSTGEPSLKKAVDTGSVSDAVEAQNRINATVQVQGGDVTTGNLEVTYNGAVGPSETLLTGPGAPTTPVLYRFTVANRTNRSLVVQLEAGFLAPRQAWSSNVTVLGLDGAPRDNLRLAAFNSLNPNDPATRQEVRVAVTTPGTAANGDRGTLQLRAFVPRPVNRSDAATRELTVATAAVPQTPGIVSYTTTTFNPSGNLAAARELQALSLDFPFTFSRGTGPESRSFRFRLDITAPADPDALFDFEFTPASAAVESTTTVGGVVRKSSRAFTMRDGDSRTVVAIITPLPGSRGNSLTFTGVVESSTDGVRAESPPFTVTVTLP